MHDEDVSPLGWIAAEDEPADAAEATALALPRASAKDGDGGSSDIPPGGRNWRQELPRWLATLDSGRTRREYEKAVGYFFEAPGVPHELGALTFDLLLAYRGSLALRADRQPPRASRFTGGTVVGHAQLPPDGAPDLLDDPAGAWDAADEQRATPGAAPLSPLAPATVNVRLTALRQFLAHCSLWEHVPQLPPERMRAALRRLKIERRRPYQVLEEQEWADFLRAAAGPGDVLDRPVTSMPPAPESANMAALTPTRRVADLGPWGLPRAARARQRVDAGAADQGDEAPDQPVEAWREPHMTQPEPATMPSMPRSHAGLTGRRTAQRDHALLALALASGLRAIELCALDVGNLAREWHQGRADWWLVLRDAQTKGQRGGRTLPLAEPLVRTLLDYIASTGRSWERATDRTTPLFLSLRAGGAGVASGAGPEEAASRRLAPGQVRRIVDRVETQWLAARGAAVSVSHGDGADTRAISPHALRHSTAVALLEGNQRAGRAPASVEHVRGWLGHFDIRTTQGYLAHLDARRHRRPFALAPEVGAPPAEADARQGAAPDGGTLEPPG
ncbi:MAG TPA: site-specific integrase [Ktedonobacterales bacterium]